MATQTDKSEYELPLKRRKLCSRDKDDSSLNSESNFADFSESSDTQFDACEGTSIDSGFNEVPQTNENEQENETQNYLHERANSPGIIISNTADSNLVERILALRNIMDEDLWHAFACQIFARPPRQRLPHISRFSDVIRLIKTSKRILVLTGAGVSVSCGIPDFRSRDGIYARLAQDFPDLPDPHAMFDCAYFRQNPRPFFKFAKEIYPGKFTPSSSHRFIKLLETQGKLLNNYTQNIDTLERVAGITRLIECHGSFARATCTKCQRQVKAEQIRDVIFEQRIPVCDICNPGVTSVSAVDENINYSELVSNGVMKPNIVFFGEDLPLKFHDCIRTDRNNCDLLLVIGSSLKVRPVAEVPNSLPAHVPQILINRERLPHLNFDVELLGDSDVIVNQICHWLGTELSETNQPLSLNRTKHLELPTKYQKYSAILSRPSTPMPLSTESSPITSPSKVELDRPDDEISTAIDDQKVSCSLENYEEKESDEDDDNNLSENESSDEDDDDEFDISRSNELDEDDLNIYDNSDTSTDSSTFDDSSPVSPISTKLDDCSVGDDINSSPNSPLSKVDEDDSDYCMSNDTTTFELSNDFTTKTKRASICNINNINNLHIEIHNSKSLVTITDTKGAKEEEDHINVMPPLPSLSSTSSGFDSSGDISSPSSSIDDRQKVQDFEMNYWDKLDLDNRLNNSSTSQQHSSELMKTTLSSATSDTKLLHIDTIFSHIHEKNLKINVGDLSQNQNEVDVSSTTPQLVTSTSAIKNVADANNDNSAFNKIIENNIVSTSICQESILAPKSHRYHHSSTNSDYLNNNDEDSKSPSNVSTIFPKINLSECLPPNTYYFRPPNRYIFPGAEVRLKRKYLKCFNRTN